MPQHDFAIGDDTGAAVLTDITLALQALAGLSSGSATPSTTYAYQPHINTTLGCLMRRDAGNNLSFPVGNADYVRYASKSGAYTVVPGDMEKLIECNTTSAGFTITLPSNSSVSAPGGGWWCLIRNSGTAGNLLVIDGASTETVNGSATITLADGETALILSTGSTAWKAMIWLYKVDIDTLRLRSNQPALELYETDTDQRWAVQANGDFINLRDVSNSRNIVRAAVGAADGSLVVADDSTTHLTAAGVEPLVVNRGTDDGDLVVFQRAGTPVGSISVASGTVSYGAFLSHHPSQWASAEAPDTDPEIGTVVETVDEACAHRFIVTQGWTQDPRGRRRADLRFEHARTEPYAGPLPDGYQGTIDHEYTDPVTLRPAVIRLAVEVRAQVDRRLPRVRICRTAQSRRVWGVFAGRAGNGDLVIHAAGAAVALVTGPVDNGCPLVAGDDGALVAAPPGADPHACVARVTIADGQEGRRLVAVSLHGR